MKHQPIPAVAIRAPAHSGPITRPTAAMTFVRLTARGIRCCTSVQDGRLTQAELPFGARDDRGRVEVTAGVPEGPCVVALPPKA